MAGYPGSLQLCSKYTCRKALEDILTLTSRAEVTAEAEALLILVRATLGRTPCDGHLRSQRETDHFSNYVASFFIASIK